MLILTIRTDKPEAEIALFDDSKEMTTKSWQAHRQLAETIHLEIKKLLEDQKKGWSDIQGVVCFQGPGSFTGLRIGLTVANSLAYSLNIPIVGSAADDWQSVGVKKIVCR